MTFINFLMSAIAVGANLISNINSNQNNNNNNNNDNNDNVANFNFVNNNNGGNNQNTIQICKYIAPNNFTRVLGTYRAYNMIYQLEIYSTFYLMLVDQHQTGGENVKVISLVTCLVLCMDSSLAKGSRDSQLGRLFSLPSQRNFPISFKPKVAIARF